MFAFGEGSIQSLPKHILKSDGRSTSDQSSQTNIDSYFAQKDELNALRVELMSKIEEIKKSLLKAPEESSQKMPEQSSHECSIITDNVTTKSMHDANPVDAMPRSLPRNISKVTLQLHYSQLNLKQIPIVSKLSLLVTHFCIE